MRIKVYFLGLKKLFTLAGLKKFFLLLNRLEKIAFFLCIFLFSFSITFLLINLYFKKTEIQPARGGKIILGEVGFPTFFNPIYSLSFDVDDSITELLFSGLLKYKEGKIVPDLIEDYKVSEDGKVFEFSLKENIFWEDGKPITSDDVIFTIKAIQNPEIKSPLRTIWLGVEITKISDKSFKFSLKNPAAVFLENCTLKIIPKHLWEKIPPTNFPLSYLNLEPLSSGPYKIEKILRDREGKVIALDLVENEKYFGKKPFIPKISFLFFENEEKLINALKSGEIDGFPLITKQEIANFEIVNFKMPRYFGVFLNLERKIFSQKEVRQALNYGTNKREILKKAIGNYGEIVNSPILPEIFGFKKSEKNYVFDLEKAKEILTQAGFEDLDNDGVKEKIEKKEPAFQFKNDLKIGSSGKEVEELQKCLAKDKEVYPEQEVTGYFGQKTKEAVIRFQEKYKEDILKPLGIEQGNGIVKENTRKKLNEICFEKKEEKIVLKFSLVTIDQPILLTTAEILKTQWKKIGFEVEVKILKPEDLKREILPKKDYDALLFGEILGIIPDPFPFWHSSQKGENGLNLSNYENGEVDKLLERIRESLDEEKREEDLEKFQEILIEDSPAIFLFNPDYLYFVSKKIKGIEGNFLCTPAKKFENIEENWYIKTKRGLK